MSKQIKEPVDRAVDEIRKQVIWLECQVVENKLRMVENQIRCHELIGRLEVERRRLDQLTENRS